jgi:hypothetical protein
MKKFLFAGLVLLLLFGCASGSFQVPKQEYQKRVQVLGVLPVLVDYASATKYPQKEALYDILARSAQGKHEFLVDRLKKKKGYFDVRSLTVNPGLTALSLLSAGSPHDEAGRPLGYLFDRATVAELTRQNVVDALLIVVLSGEQVEETRRSRTMLETLNTGYSEVYATAAVIDRNGEVLWQMAGADGFPALMLQYPDFDEAFYNKTDLVRVKNITLAGIERTLEENVAADGAAEIPEMYKDLFSEIASGISPGLLDSLR